MSEAALASGPHPRVMMALSGGVDSAVSLLLLKRQGYDVEALFMKNWEEDDEDGYCAAAEDLADAERVCDRLDVPLHTVNFSHEYWENVFTRFLREYESGRTPNPDVLIDIAASATPGGNTQIDLESVSINEKPPSQTIIAASNSPLKGRFLASCC